MKSLTDHVESLKEVQALLKKENAKLLEERAKSRLFLRHALSSNLVFRTTASNMQTWQSILGQP